MVTGLLGVTGLLAVLVVMEELRAEQDSVYHQNLVVMIVKAMILKLKNATPITVQVSHFRHNYTEFYVVL